MPTSSPLEGVPRHRAHRSHAPMFVSVHSKPKRFYGAGHLHFITCSCYERRPFFETQKRRDLFLTVLEQVRKRYRFVVVG